MKVVEHMGVVVRMDECERILAAAKERGEKEIRYTAYTEGGEPVSVLSIGGKADSSGFYLVLTVEAEKKGGYSADDVAEKLIDALGLAVLATAATKDTEIEEYCREKIKGLANWLKEDGRPGVMEGVVRSASRHLCATEKEGKR